MNIVVLSTDFRPRLGGIAEFAFQVCKELAASGHDVSVVTHAMDGAPDEETMGGYGVHRIFARPPSQSIYTLGGLIRRPLWSLASQARIQEFVSRHRPDVLLCTNPATLWVGVTAWAALPYALMVHGDDIAGDFGKRNPIPGMLMRRLIRRAYWTFYNSTYSQTSIEKAAGVAAGRSTAIGCGFPLEEIVAPGGRAAARRELGWGDEPVMLTVCRLVLRKGVDTTLRAIQLAATRGVRCRYVVLGDGPDRVALELLAIQLGLDDRVTFMGRVDEPTKRRVYQAADLYVMPSRPGPRGEVEGFGISFLEANAYGLAVIGGRAGGIVDSVADGVNGLLVEPQDVEAIAAAMADLLGDADRRARMAAAGQDRIRQRYNWPAIVSQIEPRLAQAVAGAGLKQAQG